MVLDHHDASGRRRKPSTGLSVRDERGRLDPVRRERILELARHKAAQLRLEKLRADASPELITLEGAFALYHDEERGGLPTSRSSRGHHRGSRADWMGHFERLYGKRYPDGIPWNAIRPADVWALAAKLKADGKVATAEKRVENLRAVYRWLTERAGYEGLKNPARGFDWKRLREGYTPDRPRTDAETTAALIKAAPEIGPEAGPKLRLLLALITESGARIVQVRTVWRSQVDVQLQPAPPPGLFPHGVAVFAAVKGQRPMIWPMTQFARAELDAALASWLAPLEERWTAEEVDYPVFTNARPPIDPESEQAPVSDRETRVWLAKAYEKAGLERPPRQAWHAFRREVSDYLYSATSLETLTTSLGWSSQDTPESIYVDARRYPHLARALEAMEGRRGEE